MTNLKKDHKLVFKTYYRLMQVKSIVLSTYIKLPLVIRIFILSILVAVLLRFYCTTWVIMNSFYNMWHPSHTYQSEQKAHELNGK